MGKEFCTIINSLKSPQNVGMIVRSHIAYGGSELIFTGYDCPWKFNKGTKAFSRELEKDCVIKYIPDQFKALEWCREENYSSVAVEIKEDPVFLDEFLFPGRVAIVLGNEGMGLNHGFMDACDHIVTIRQFGGVGSLNVAVSASIAMYELNRNSRNNSEIIGNSYMDVNV